MFKPCFQAHLNSSVLQAAKSIRYTVADLAPNDEKSLFNESSLIIWSGASDNTIWQDSSVNWAFRALHDKLHLESGLGFSVSHEVILGSLQPKQFKCPLIQRVIEVEILEQALHYQRTGSFVEDQVAFMRQCLKNDNRFKGLML